MKCPNCGNDKFYIFDYFLNNNHLEEEREWEQTEFFERANPVFVEEDSDRLLSNLSDEDLRHCREEEEFHVTLDICTKCGTALS